MRKIGFRPQRLISGPSLAAFAAFALLGIVISGPARGQSGNPAPAPPSASPATSSATFSPTPNARPLEIDSGSHGLWQTLLQLHTRASLLMITAHPDDEDGGMLTFESRDQGVRSSLLTLTRGEGGQNVMSDDFYDALGLVRTEELLAADRYYDVNQFWGTEVDFGFSKTREEALEQWGHDRVLEDVVRVVRMARPLVVTSVFVGGPTDGHGHHAVAGQMAQEVFKAAGDPSVFPDQIKAGLRPWSPVKMYARVPSFQVNKEKGMFDYATGKWMPVRFYDFMEKKWSEGIPAVNVEIPEGNEDRLLGATYIQTSRQGWSLQKSQNGGGVIPFAAPISIAYHRYGSLVQTGEKEQSYFDGIDVSLAGIADFAPAEQHQWLAEALVGINATVESAIDQFSLDDPRKIASSLAEGLKQTNALAAQVSSSNLSEQAKYDILHELAVKQRQFQRAIAQSLGISLEVTVANKREAGPAGPYRLNSPSETFAYAVPGQTFPVGVHIYNPNNEDLTLNRVWLDNPNGERWTFTPESPVPAVLPGGKALDQQFQVHLPDDAAPTRPYFYRPNDEQAYYNLIDPQYRNLSFAPYPLAAWVEFTYHGVQVRAGQVVQTVRQETGRGMVLNPLMVTPPVSVRIAPQAGVIPLSSKSFSVTALLHTEAQTGTKGSVKLDLPQGWRSEPGVASFAMDHAGEERHVAFEVFPDRLEQKQYTVTAVADSGGRQYREGFITAGYPGIRPYNLYVPSTYRASGVDLKFASDLHIAYVMGTGDAVPLSLANVGIKMDLLSPDDVALGDLRKYDVIVIGVRAYTARPELANNNNRLLEYVKNGGALIVQYQSVQYDHNFGPYPYSLPNDAERVVDEKSHVTFVDPQSPVLTWPNRLDENDFAGWVEERGHSFLKSWDSHYRAPLEMHDPDQEPQRGGLVYAKYGRGVYVYVAFALYRQLPDGVPGAYRLIANLLSLPRNPALKQPESAVLTGVNTSGHGVR